MSVDLFDFRHEGETSLQAWETGMQASLSHKNDFEPVCGKCGESPADCECNMVIIENCVESINELTKEINR